eukprot:920818_1
MAASSSNNELILTDIQTDQTMNSTDEQSEFDEPMNPTDDNRRFSQSVSISVMNPPNQENDGIVSLFSEKEIIDMQQLLPFIWSMTEMQLQWIKQCQIKEQFVSDSFKINEALFVLVFVPQQETSKSSLHLKLLQLPNNLNGIVINVTTKCKPLSASDSKIFDASYSRDRSSNLLQISFDDFKHHLFTNTDLFNVFECDFKVLKVYKTDTSISKNVHPFEWNLKPAQVQYFLEGNQG